ncbi:MAG: isopropylmalate/homocitrate/citramalate synthase [Oscillospiraceae bacterium]|jgi:homocitrate synthase NifV|nr:isopropylmalate/homocitrate/citramalate synthase [Oscillospiraceae bacterium]
MKSQKFIIDTTLRDGEQSPGLAFNKEQKVLLAGMLDQIGVYQIEAGIPALGKYEKNTLCEIMAQKKKSLISVWNRANLNDIKHSMECNPDIIHISIPVSYVQIYKKLNKNKTWIFKEMAKCVCAAKEQGYEVTLGFEDASRADVSFLMPLALQAKELGVKRIRFADTVGVLTPTRCYELVNEFVKYTGVEVEIHTHNDLGMAVPNAVQAAKAGADYIDTTILGIGERAGNCDFQKLIYAAERIFNLNISHYTSLTVEERARRIIEYKKL